MASLDNSLKHVLERMLGMQTGYVLNFSNNTFADFVQTSVGFDPYERYVGSKAVILRAIWQREPDAVVGKLMTEMLDRWRSERLLAYQPITDSEQALYEDSLQKLSRLIGDEASAVDLAFLERDLGDVDLRQLQVPITLQQLIQQRLDEVERCMAADAPLAVIFLCGSTLEGLLLDVAAAQQSAFLGSQSAPRRQGRIRPLNEWTLANLIAVSREQGVIGEDIVKHTAAVRDFRNYIHPRQQLAENFTPRAVTAEIARKVLMAAIADLSRLG